MPQSSIPAQEGGDWLHQAKEYWMESSGPLYNATLHPERKHCSDHQTLRGGSDARCPLSGCVPIFAPAARQVRSPAAPRGAPEPLSTTYPPHTPHIHGPTANSCALWRGIRCHCTASTATLFGECAACIRLQAVPWNDPSNVPISVQLSRADTANAPEGTNRHLGHEPLSDPYDVPKCR